MAEGGALRDSILKLPPALRTEYERICAENAWFTIADLWSVIKNQAKQEKSAEELLLSLGYINQQALANSIDSGVSGSDWGHSWRPGMLGEGFNVGVIPEYRTLGDLRERAEFSLPAPAFNILALLSPDDIHKLRERAHSTIFGIEIKDKADSSDIERITKDAMLKYWSFVCEYLYKRFPQYTQEKTELFVMLEKNTLSAREMLRRIPGELILWK